MKHKPHLNLKEQVEQLQNRNLTITNQENSAKYLSAISYHRFNSYRFAFLENDKISREHYQKNTTFEDLINLYNEDIEYKNCLNILIQFIEIAFKTQIIYHFSKLDPLFYTKNKNYLYNRNNDKTTLYTKKIIESITQQSRDVNNIHIAYYYENNCKCGCHNKPLLCKCISAPAWIGLEGLSFGTMINLYKLSDMSKDIKNEIAYFFGINDTNCIKEKSAYLKSILGDIARIRNIIAHYDKILGRESFIQPESCKFISNIYNNIKVEEFNTDMGKTYLPYFLLIKHIIKSIISNMGYPKYLGQIYDKFLQLSQTNQHHLKLSPLTNYNITIQAE